jgi:hypothetical protein
MFEVETVPHSCIPQVQIGLSIALCMRILLLVESFDFRPRSQCSLVSIIPSFIHFVNMCLCQISLLLMCNPRHLILDNILVEEGVHCLYVLVGRFSLCGECGMDQLGFISF